MKSIADFGQYSVCMITIRGGRITIRRTFDFYFGWLLTPLIIFMAIDGLRYGAPGSFGDNLLLLSVAFPAAWLGWLATVHPKIVIEDSGLTVVNWFITYAIPWRAVSHISRSEALAIHLRSGESLRAAVGSLSIVGTAWRRRLKRQLQMTIEQHQQHPQGDDNIVRKRLDVQLVPFTSLLIVLIFLAWFLAR